MRNRNKKYSLLVITCVLIVSISILPASMSADANLNPAPKTIDIGVSIELTGPTAMAGELLRRGYELALEKVNEAGGIDGIPVRLVYEDDKGTNPGIVAAANKLVYEHKVLAILGCARSTQVHAIHPLIAEAKVPTIYAGTAWSLRELNNPWLFGIRANDRARAEAVATYLVEGLGHEKVASLHADEAYGQGGSEETAKFLASKYGIKPLIELMFTRGTKDFTPQLLRIKESGATGVYVWCPNPEDEAILLRQKNQLGLTVDMIGGAFADVATLVPIAGKDADGVYSVGDYIPEMSTTAQYLDDRSMQDYGIPASFVHQEAYDGLIVLVDAIKRAEIIKTIDGNKMMMPLSEARTAIAEALRQTRNLTDGVTKEYSCDEYGDLAHTLVVVRIENGRHVLIDAVDLLADN